ncbi:MAG: formate hydrogenlyase [Gammaproteobacteria bacterium]|nr:MAG: formate hydrogenlyase [Gammaproteobacteria bacterium]
MDQQWDLTGWLLALGQTLALMALAPLYAGWIKWVKCHLQNRRAPSIFQPYRGLNKLFHKRPILAENASVIFRMAPYILLGAMLLAASAVPFVTTHLPTTAVVDMIVLVGYFALAKFFLVLAGMDVGTSFGGMGSSREANFSAFAEPAMLLVVFTLAMVASSTNLSIVMQALQETGLVLRPSLAFILAALLMVGLAENGRIPVDNPATHLELTMIHEAMILEYSGRYLAMVEWAAQVKLMLYGVLIVNIFFPFDLAADLTAPALLLALGSVLIKLAFMGAGLAVVETGLAKMRLFRVPTFLILAFMLAFMGMFSHILLEVA